LKNKKTPGQIVVILTLVLAVLILLTVVIINIAKVSDIKTATSQIADSGTLRLCSQLAAYSNLIYQKLAQRANFGCRWVSARVVECLNWGLIIPLGGLLLSIVLMAFGGPAGWISGVVLSFLSINPLLNEVNSIMKGGFSNAAAELTQYSAMRETAIESMLESAQFDPIHADRVSPGRYRYIERHQDPVTHAWIIDRVYNYDLTHSPITAKIAGKEDIPRYVAWYWSMRYPLVTEARLAPFIETFINDGLLPITEFNVWDPVKWNYDEVSLKVEMPAAEITCHSGSCPDWVNKEENFVRILGHVTRQEPDPLIGAKAWLGLVTGSGFLSEQFIPLTTRLLRTNTYRPMISYATPGFSIFDFNIGYNFDKVLEVIEALRGLMVRDMELLNLPVAHRIPTIDNWLRVWYDRDDHSADIYTRLQSEVIPRLEQWKSDLEAIDAIMRPWILGPHGTCCHYGVFAKTCSDCEISWCCDCSDCDCMVCCNPAPCAWEGDYCSCSHSNICTGAGDLYLHKAHSAHGCPLANMDPGCTCDRCADVWAAGAHEESCRFQGDYTWAHMDGPSEVGQAVRILEEFIEDLNTLTDAIEAFATEAYAVLYPDAATQALQREAAYGWHDRQGNLNLVRVLLEGYPAREDLPRIKESYIWGGLLKRWEIIGELSGENVNFTVSRYSSDVSVGVLPSRWWNLRYRSNSAGEEWDRGTVMGLIDNIQTTATIAVPASGWNTYAITSATRGFYGLRKEDVRIERIR
jgi:hypothetical protein